MHMPGMRSLSLLLCSALLALCTAQAPQEGDVKLVGGATDYKGTVAVFHDGQWGSICDDSWQYQDADVVCRMLGFERSFRIYYRAYYGALPDDSQIWIDQIRCSRDSKTLLDCEPEPAQWGNHDCTHKEDAGVECLRKFPRKPLNMAVRLDCPQCVQWGSCTTCPGKDHPSPTDCTPQAIVEGIVFANYEDKWAPVSGEGWDIKDARVVCGELGYSVALPVPRMYELWTNWDGDFLQGCGDGAGLISGPSYPRCDLLGEGSGALDGLCTTDETAENDDFRKVLGSTLLKKVQCSGNERRLLDCYFPEFGPHDNPTLKVATVRCGFKPHRDCERDPKAEVYRTRGSPVPWEGRVEVRVEGAWGTVCQNDFDLPEANIICRALGYGTAVRAHYQAYYGRGVGPIHYSDLRCNGSERTLGGCEKKTVGRLVAQRCTHRFDAGVACNRPTVCEDPDAKRVRLVQVPQPLYFGYVDNFVQVNGNLGWGALCRVSLDLGAANVICRSERRLFAIQTRSGVLPGVTVRYSGVLRCSGGEASIEECEVDLHPTLTCAGELGGDTILDCTTSLPDLVPDLGTIQRSLTRYPYLDRLPIYYLRCAQSENCLSSSADGQGDNDFRSLLRFDSLTMNYGTTDFRPNTRRDQWQFHDCHNHFHSFEAFIHYDLLNFTTNQKVAEGHKASFCLEDSTCDAGGGRRFSCSSGIQGISANCGDLYGRYLDCQWIDVTDVPHGFYKLRLTVNPDTLVLESDHGNNDVTCTVELSPNFGMRQYGCRLSDH